MQYFSKIEKTGTFGTFILKKLFVPNAPKMPQCPKKKGLNETF
jgi:hypothetical protein